MLTFLKAQTASFGATVLDFLVTVLAVEFFKSWYVSASFFGTIVGGVFHYSLGRSWVFHSHDPKVLPQAMRYFVIWSGSLFLNAASVFLITHYAGISYIISKILASILVGIGYNYLMQKKFVFR